MLEQAQTFTEFIMKLLILVFALGINTTHLRGQDTLFEYKVHYITSKDLSCETEVNVNQIFVLGKKPHQQQLHFKDSLKFEKRVFVAIDSFAFPRKEILEILHLGVCHALPRGLLWIPCRIQTRTYHRTQSREGVCEINDRRLPTRYGEHPACHSA